MNAPAPKCAHEWETRPRPDAPNAKRCRLCARETIGRVQISEQEFAHHTEGYDGICLACGTWTTGGCEPDARGYPCEACRERRVYGAEEALMMGRIELS